VANRPAPALRLRDGDRKELTRWARSSSIRAGLAQRARIVLLAADGVSNTAIADTVGVSRPTVIGWRDRYLAKGIDGLGDEPRSGRPRTIDHAGVITATLTPPPRKLGVTHWSHQEFLAFLRQVARTYPEDGSGTELHLVMDNYAAHKQPKIRAWLAANPQVVVHFTPTHASWMNLVEVWFSLIERQAIHRGTFRSVRDLNAKIRAYIDGWNDRSHPFVWTKTADQILTKANRQKTSNAGH
jgi:transposase